MKKYSTFILGILLATGVAGSFVGAKLFKNEETPKINDLVETATDPLSTLAVNAPLKAAGSEIKYSETYVQYGTYTKDSVEYKAIRFSTAVYLGNTSGVDSIYYRRTVGANVSSWVEIKTAYRGIKDSSNTDKFYDPVNGLVSVDPGNGYYFACYTISIKPSSFETYKNEDFTMEISLNGTENTKFTCVCSYENAKRDVSDLHVLKTFDLNNNYVKKNVVQKKNSWTAIEKSNVVDPSIKEVLSDSGNKIRRVDQTYYELDPTKWNANAINGYQDSDANNGRGGNYSSSAVSPLCVNVDDQEALYMSALHINDAKQYNTINGGNDYGYSEVRFKHTLAKCYKVSFEYKYWDVNNDKHASDKGKYFCQLHGAAYKSMDMTLVNDNQWHTFTAEYSDAAGYDITEFVVKIYHMTGELFINKIRYIDNTGKVEGLYEDCTTNTVFLDKSSSSYACEENKVDVSGYTFALTASGSAIDASTIEAGKSGIFYGTKDSTKKAFKGLVATKVINNGATFLSALNAKSSGQANISGYFVIANDINDLSSSQAWSGVEHDYKLSGTLDGRNHKLTNPQSTSTGGIFSARHFESFKIKDLTFQTAKPGGYGLFSYYCLGMTLQNVKFSLNNSGYYPYSIFAHSMQEIKFIDCEFDTSNHPNCYSLAVYLINPIFKNTTIKANCKNYVGLCQYIYKGGQVAYQGEYDASVNWVWTLNNYKHLDAAEANYDEGAHGEGYYCEDCDKYFADSAHKTEIPKEKFYTSDKLPSTKVVGKQLFYNLATKTIDNSEAPTVDVTKLVDGKKNALVFAGAKAGDTQNVYLPGETTYQYELVVVTDVIAAEGDFATKLNASSTDLSGYYVVTKNLGTVNTVNAGSLDAATSVEVTVDGRGHAIDLFIVKNGTGGMFGSCGANKSYNVIFKNLIINKAVVSSYGMFGYKPANNGGQSLLIENCDITGGGNGGFRYGLISALSNTRISIKNSIFDFSKNDFSGKAEVYSGSFLFQSGTRGTYENVTLIIILAHDTYKNNYTEGSKEYKDVIKPDAAIANAAAAERDTNSLVSKITGLTFLTARS